MRGHASNLCFRSHPEMRKKSSDSAAPNRSRNQPQNPPLLQLPNTHIRFEKSAEKSNDQEQTLRPTTSPRSFDVLNLGHNEENQREEEPVVASDVGQGSWIANHHSPSISSISNKFQALNEDNNEEDIQTGAEANSHVATHSSDKGGNKSAG